MTMMAPTPQAKRWIMLGVTLAAALVLAVMLLGRGAFSGNESLLPGFDEQVPAVARLRLAGPRAAVELARTKDGSWVLASAANAPARAEMVDQALDAMASAGIAASPPKDLPATTSGLDAGVQVTVRDAGGKVLAALTIGKPAGDDQVYARVEGASAPVIASGLPALPLEAARWTTLTLPVIAPARIKSVRVLHADGDIAAFARGAAGQSFQLTSGDATRANPAAIDQSARVYAELAFTGLASAKDISWPGASMIFVETFDGLVVTLLVKPAGAVSQVRINAHFVAPLGVVADARAKGEAEARAINDLRAYAFTLPAAQAAVLNRRGAALQRG